MKKDAPSLHEHIRLEAFLLSEKAGHPTGMDEFFWAQAEAMVHGRTAVVVGPGNPPKAKTKTGKGTPEKAVKKAVATKSQPIPKVDKTAKPKAKATGKRTK